MAKLWPKINTFLWLVAHKSILTWDNLMKRGFVGPSICPLFLAEAETQNHLLNLCSYNSQVWDHGALVMHTSDRNHDRLKETIEGWCETTFDLPSSTAYENSCRVSSSGSSGKNGTNVFFNPHTLNGERFGKEYKIASSKPSTCSLGKRMTDLSSS
jgi:hypothetical protein